MAKKSARITVALECPDCKSRDYHTSVNKDNKPATIEKFCNHTKCRKKTSHKLKEKLK